MELLAPPRKLLTSTPLGLSSILVARILVIAHRGASAEKPENTLAAFRRAVELKVDAIELDVRVTRDGIPVVFHDHTLGRLTGVAGRVSSRSWRELALLRVGGAEPIPRLAEVLRLIRGRTVVQIELKPGTPVAPVVRAVHAARAGKNVILSSFAPDLVRVAARLAPATPRLLLSNGGSPSRLARQLSALRARGLSVDHRAVRSAAWVRHFHRHNFIVWCWTVNHPRTMRRLARWGVDGILSDNPALLQKTV
jgi:glycerophosphoryl diester phosphodiesterase